MSMSHIRKLESIGKKWIEDALEVKPSDLPTTVYHYTDAAGLFGMLATDKIWLTDYRFLNDRTEFTHTKGLLKSILEETKKDPKRSAMHHDFVDLVEKYQSRDTNEDAFVFSLSEESDDLSQWRGYAREGLGFTIGFDAQKIYDFVTHSTDNYSFCGVDYVTASQVSALERSMAEFEAMLFSDEFQHQRDIKKLISLGAQNFDWVATNRASRNKHSSFAAEKEWRIVRYVAKKAAEIKVRVSGARLIPYVEIGVQPPGTKLPITKIGIGPGFSEPEIIDSVHALMRMRGYNPQVYFADTPYRRV